MQENKQKVQPVMDYRKLDKHDNLYTAGAEVCAHKLREWWQQGSDVAILDLRRAYLQIRVEKSLWQFQTVEIKGTRYCLTRLGFSLNVVPSIMTAIMSVIWQQDEAVRQATSSYIDDIFVNEGILSAQAVKEHFESFGLMCKKPERLRDGAKVLSLRVGGSKEELRWRRGGDVSGVLFNVTRRSIFSVCRKLVGHYPMYGWLRVAVVAIKWCATSVSSGWDDEVRDATLQSMLTETVARVTHDDPVRGNWCVDGNEFTVWVDASLLTLGVALVVDEFIIEDACWLRPENDSRHINLAELDATLKGVNLVLQWQTRVPHIITDSVCVHQWITDALSRKAQLTTKASSEMLIRRRLATLVKTIREYDLTVDVALVQFCQNHTDHLTRVPFRWLDLPKEGGELALANCAGVGGRLVLVQVAKFIVKADTHA